ncbi:uncharacterized protein G2W53_034038 [Senna tora]|uniref:Endonuclease/exonuclease/phosphatase domain-containing protein n=1 Tax=Senna tora TaxID=362788 RepID=A0A834T3D4_9FABA|nr:uncharacterized protein G2W53_034038 [Senna tora]
MNKASHSGNFSPASDNKSTPVISSSSSGENHQSHSQDTCVPSSLPIKHGPQEGNIFQSLRPPDQLPFSFGNQNNGNSHTGGAPQNKPFDICDDSSDGDDQERRGPDLRHLKINLSIFVDFLEHQSYLGYTAVAISEASGHSGGIWVLSNYSKEKFSTLYNNHQAVTISVKNNGASWVFFAVYGSLNLSTREQLWKHLEEVKCSISCPWLLLGDFNDILLPNEVAGGSFYPHRAEKFANMMEACNLMDLRANGSPFTWRRNTKNNNKVAKRLDRAL